MNLKIQGGAVLEQQTLRTFLHGETFPVADPSALAGLLLRGAGVPPRSGARSVQAILLFAGAFHDAGGACADPEGTAVLSWGRTGSHPENLRYWHDYLAAGRTDGRGRFFVGTLATTPVCDAAIVCGLRGGILYLDTFGAQAPLREEIGDLFDAGARAVLLTLLDPPVMRAFLLERTQEADEWSALPL